MTDFELYRLIAQLKSASVLALQQMNEISTQLTPTLTHTLFNHDPISMEEIVDRVHAIQDAADKIEDMLP